MNTFSQTVVTDSNLWLHAAIAGHAYHAQALDFLRHCVSSGVGLVAPALWEAEVDSSLRKLRSINYINEQSAIIAQKWIDAPPIKVTYHPEMRLLARQIANIIQAPRVYDTTYVALAQLTHCEFWTADQRLFNAINNARVAAAKRQQILPLPEIHFIANYAGQYTIVEE